MTDIDTADLAAHARALLDAGERLALAAASHDGDVFTVAYVFGDGPARTELRVRVPVADPRLPSLAGLSFPAGRFEREMADLYGIVPVGHPKPNRLVRHHHWPRSWFPMRADAKAAPPFGDPEGPYPFLAVEGPGVYEIPVGPVHAGLIEPGHFRFSVVGETVLKLKARLWFVHKGIEKLFEGRAPAAGIELAERISGDTAVGHTLAYCRAVEDALGAEVPAEAAAARALLLELERLYNHATDLGALCNDVAHGILNAHAGRVRERLLRLNDRVTGHRLLRGGVVLGGARLRALPEPGETANIAADLAEIAALAQGHTVVADRFDGTAVLAERQARELGTLGYVARASGLDRDLRALELPGFRPALATGGDVAARFAVRAAECAASAALVTALADRTGPGEHLAPLPPARAACGTGQSEAWRGTATHRVQLAADGTLARVKVVDPSFFNWPALPVALSGAIVPDFPLVNKSFNLSYAGNDL